MISRFLIALIPPEPICEEITGFKKYCWEKYHSKGALSSPPHITLHMPFEWREEKTDVLNDTLQQVAKGHEDFIISLKNFSGFPPRVVFVNVESNKSLSSLQKDIVKHGKENLHLNNANYRDLPFHPHITLAFKDLKKENYEKAMRDFQTQKYERTFTAGKISLLRHNGERWEEMSAFGLC